MPSGRITPVRRYWPALLFILLGALVGLYHNRTVDRGKSDLIESGVRGAVSPPASWLDRFARWFDRETAWIVRGRAQATENRELRDRVALLQQENDRLRDDSVTAERLRGELGFVKSSARQLLAAHVIALRPDPNFDTLVIDRGSSSGVKPDSVIISRYGIVGHVYDVTFNTASVLMLTDQNSGIGARVQRSDSRAIGVCKGANSALLSLVYLPVDCDVKAGDRIVSSGLGGVFPAGLVIGQVVDVGAQEGNALKSAHVRPAVDLERLDEVYVLR